MSLANAGRPEQQHVLAVGDPTRTGKLAHLLGIDGGLCRKVEALPPTIASYSPSGRSRVGAGGAIGDNASSLARLGLNRSVLQSAQAR
jgi:hypothetical protein